MNTLPSCGTTTPVPTAILSIIANGVNPNKLAAATAYAQTRLEPITTLVSNDVSSIILNNYAILIFIITIAVLAILLWVCSELHVEGYLVAGAVLLVLIVAIGSFLLFESYARAQVNRAVDGIVSSFISQLTEGTLLAVVNGAAQEYLDEIGITC